MSDWSKRLASLTRVAALVKIGATAGAVAGEATTLSELRQATHFHGIAVDRIDPSRLFLATHHGFYLVNADGAAIRLSPIQDFMGFTPHPSDPLVFYASGHPAGGGNLGFIESADGGVTWTQVSPGVGGPVDFHQMDVSAADPNVIYGVYHGLQVSRDGGKTWTMNEALPDGVIDLAASPTSADRLYAATKGDGLQASDDAGASWRRLYAAANPVSMVQAGPAGTLFMFVLGEGLLSASESDSASWSVLSNGFGDRYVLHLAIDPANPARLFAITQESEVLASGDGGKSWQPFGAN
ncbi:MAG: F510_1955 family glycosylhydrolase [Dongiaceae bacterium]